MVLSRMHIKASKPLLTALSIMAALMGKSYQCKTIACRLAHKSQQPVKISWNFFAENGVTDKYWLVYVFANLQAAVLNVFDFW